MCQRGMAVSDQMEGQIFRLQKWPSVTVCQLWRVTDLKRDSVVLVWYRLGD